MNMKTFLTMTTLTSVVLLLSACGGGGGGNNGNPRGVDDTPPITDEQPAPLPEARSLAVQIGTDLNTGDIELLSSNPGGPADARNQSLRAGDILTGSEIDDLLIGGLGVDVLIGGEGNDVLIGGTEDFNANVDGDGLGADNRDRAFGGAGEDVFIWAPGDGSDFFDGGEGTDVVIFGIIGEARDADGSTEGAPFFNVNPNGAGSQDFDGIALDENGLPQVRVSNSPGFCSMADKVANRDAFEQLGVDHIARFSLRGIANAFDAGERSDDDGLRVSITLDSVEFVVCTRRDFDAEAGIENIEVLDIRGDTPVLASLEDIPVHVLDLLR